MTSCAEVGTLNAVWLNRDTTVMIHFIRFNVVGIVGLALQTGELFVLTHRPHPLGYLAATAAAVALAVLNKFVWHQRWTWSDGPSATRGETLPRLVTSNITNGPAST